MLHPLKPSLTIRRASYAPAWLARLLSRETAVNTGQRHHFTYRNVKILYNRSKMKTNSKMCDKWFLYKLRNIASCYLPNLEARFRRKPYMCVLELGVAMF